MNYKDKNREIKFRIFDPVNKNMFYSGINDYDDSFITMQYTGLKDKNGIEIYEGDIIQFFYLDRYIQQ